MIRVRQALVSLLEGRAGRAFPVVASPFSPSLLTISFSSTRRLLPYHAHTAGFARLLATSAAKRPSSSILVQALNARKRMGKRKTTSATSNAEPETEKINEHGILASTPLSSALSLEERLFGDAQKLKFDAAHASMVLSVLTEPSQLNPKDRKELRKLGRTAGDVLNGHHWKVAVVGRPNVGKSTLFNRLVGKPSAIVDAGSGVTRDYREDKAFLAGLEFTAIDTAGLEEMDKESRRGRRKHDVDANFVLGAPLSPDLQAGILTQTQRAVEEADIVLFTVDVRTGLTPIDTHFAKWLRKVTTVKEGPAIAVVKKPVILVGNKYDYGAEEAEEGYLDCFRLGLGDPVLMSATHNTGMADLFAALVKAMGVLLPSKVQETKERQEKRAMSLSQRAATSSTGSQSARTATTKGMELPGGLASKAIDSASLHDAMDKDEDEEFEATGVQIVKVALVGKPNVGKSTMVNAILQKQRVLTGPQPGITRDSVSIPWEDDRFPLHSFELVDTAGLKGTTSFQHSKYSKVDAMAMSNSLRTVDLAHVVLLVLDVTDGLYDLAVDPVFADSLRAAHNASAKGLESTNPETHFASREMLLQRVSGVLSRSDIEIARYAVDQGRALVILANKTDQLRPTDAANVVKGLQLMVDSVLPGAKEAAVIGVSALHPQQRQGLDRAVEEVVRVFDKWRTRVSTGLLNRWLKAVTALKPPPMIDGKALKMKYVTQTSSRPPSFVVFCNRPSDVPPPYLRFLANGIRQEFGLKGVPLRLHLRATENPYHGGKGRAHTSASKPGSSSNNYNNSNNNRYSSNNNRSGSGRARERTN